MSYPIVGSRFGAAQAANEDILLPVPPYEKTSTALQNLCVYTAIYLQYAYCAQENNSFSSQLAYHLAGRALLIVTGAAVLTESVIKATVLAVAVLVELATCEVFQLMLLFGNTLYKEAELTQGLSWECFSAFLTPETLVKKFLAYNGPLSAELRENRLVLDEAVVEKKLKKELKCAQEHMSAQSAKSFNYTHERVQGTSKPEEIGPYTVGIYATQGRRNSMEDAHLCTSFTLHVNGTDYPVQLFAVFDGHGGRNTAEYVRDHLQAKLLQMLELFNPQALTHKGIWNALKITFVELNRDFLKIAAPLEKSGTTAIVSIIIDGKLWTANVGDSRALITAHGRTIQLSEDAKPNDSRYERGVNRRGAKVIHYGVWRVDRILATARALGDFWVKGVSARPKITMLPLASIPAGSCLVICCDGVFDVASSCQVGDVAIAHKNKSVHVLAKNIVTAAHKALSQDNLSALVIKIPKAKEAKAN